ncbi:hypothetical protein TIFTF001_017344 [Ficus carica]|uniref:Uncharacterized protein n=1 Tax=Ficus carica TaxID=3494 RepID=A0AA88D9L1_FICCA|nr:hypothetical protein TIFTF001_017344 [Ficus carica]
MPSRFPGKTVEELVEKTLSWVAGEVHEFLQGTSMKEHFLGLIDWVEQFPMSKIDFRWGKPVFGSYHFPWGGNAGYIMPMPSTVGTKINYVVYMHMPKKGLEIIETKASHVFRPFTFDCLNVKS